MPRKHYMNWYREVYVEDIIDQHYPMTRAVEFRVVYSALFILEFSLENWKIL